MKHTLIATLLASVGLFVTPVYADHDHGAHAVTSAAAKDQPENMMAGGKACKKCKKGKMGAGGHDHGAQTESNSDARLSAMEKRLDAIQATLEQLAQGQAAKKP